MTKIMQLGEPINWSASSNDKQQKVTLGLFGECGTGKSTVLSLISQIYSDKYKVKKEAIISFESAKSIKAVTTKVKVATMG